MIWPDGSEHWIEGRGVIERDAEGRAVRIIGAAMDQTGRKRAQLALIEREEALRVTAELSTDYMFVVDLTHPERAPDIIAGSLERTTGYTPAQIAVLGGWAHVIHPDDAGVVSQIDATMREGRTYFIEYRILDPAGHVRCLQERGRGELDVATGQPKRLVGGVREVSERKQLEQQLIDSRKMEALARLAGSLAHDFNNLLTVLLIWHRRAG